MTAGLDLMPEPRADPEVCLEPLSKRGAHADRRFLPTSSNARFLPRDGSGPFSCALRPPSPLHLPLFSPRPPSIQQTWAQLEKPSLSPSDARSFPPSPPSPLAIPPTRAPSAYPRRGSSSPCPGLHTCLTAACSLIFSQTINHLLEEACLLLPPSTRLSSRNVPLRQAFRTSSTFANFGAD
jgi:hypothetical protein